MGANYKFIFTGPSGAGKSTAINSLSDIPIVYTEAKSSAKDSKHADKNTITVALDYGLIRLSNQDKVHLYGTPGQERFDFMWDVLTEGGLGLILLIDNARTDPLEDLRFFVQTFRKFIDKTQVVIGITRTDIQATPRLVEYHAVLAQLGLNPPVFEVDARKKRDVSLLLQALLYSLDPRLQKGEVA